MQWWKKQESPCFSCGECQICITDVQKSIDKISGQAKQGQYIMQNIKETSDTLRGPKVNARKHWDGESWILEDAKTRKPLLIGTSSQILDEYDRRNKSL